MNRSMREILVNRTARAMGRGCGCVFASSNDERRPLDIVKTKVGT
jgi:hypothetical protein